MIEELKNQFFQSISALQEQITQELRKVDPEIVLEEDLWERTDFAGAPGGGGRSRAFTGSVIEKAGVNISRVFGKVDPQFGKGLKGGADELWACGISLIIHPRNPRVPTVHMNFRMIENGQTLWFGGGADLTPYYPHEEDFHYFHEVWRKACAPYGSYDWMKKECDEYFVNHHRQGEMRGIGGIFFDHYNSGHPSQDQAMVLDLSTSFIPSYFPLVEKRKAEAWTEEDEDFQLHRRGRYVEFNLIHDRGTLFGLRSNGRTESILISLPPRVKFTYKYEPPKGSVHEKMMTYYRPFNWGR